MSGVTWGYCSDADVSGDFTVLELDDGICAELACNSAIPGCGAWSLVQNWPPRFSESLALRSGDSMVLEAME
jgi:hypothetical protein